MLEPMTSARLLTLVSILVGACSGSPTPAPAPPPPVEDPSCPSPKPASDALCVQDCGPPVAREDDPPPAWQWLSPEDAENRKKFGCPRCLPPEALIATPTGDVPIGSLAPGALVWSTDEHGQRIAVPVLRVGSTPAPREHALVVIDLADGREVTASPGHPTADDRALGTLRVGESLDGSRIVAVRKRAFGEQRTFDLLPASVTRQYWVDGVLMSSTLR
ncbi:hypothetical protein BH11MYX3_BH11MYX3_03720 [soil metagenome]